MEVMKSENKLVSHLSSTYHRVDASWIRIIFIALKKEALPAEIIFETAGVSVDRLKDQEFVSQKSIHILYSVIEEYNALSHLPIYVTSVFQFHYLRYVGNILPDAISLNDLLAKIAFIVSKISQLIEADISTDAKYAKLGLSSAVPSSELHPISLAIGVCLIVEIVNRIFPDVSNAVVNVIISDDTPVMLLQEHFKCPVVVSTSGVNAVVFDRKSLNKINIFPSHSIKVSDAIYNNTTISDLNIYSEAEQLIIKNIDKPDFTISDVAEHMNMSAKTLQRVLGRFDTSFSQLAQLNKKRLATFFLKERQLSIQQISFALGFVSPSSFSRAFKKWTGCSPSKFQYND